MVRTVLIFSAATTILLYLITKATGGEMTLASTTVGFFIMTGTALLVVAGTKAVVELGKRNPIRSLGFLIMIAGLLLSAYTCAFDNSLVNQPVVYRGQTICGAGILGLSLAVGFAMILRGEKGGQK